METRLSRTTGAQNYDSALTVNSTIGLNVDGTTLTIGGPLDFNAADDVSIAASLNVPGSITIEGDKIAISGNLTSTDTGDIFIQSNSTVNNAISVSGDIIKTGGGRSTLTLRSDGRADLGDATASGSAILDTVLWTDYHNTNSGGAGNVGDIDTNGGHVWVGGSASDGGSTTWNGIAVGDGASEGTMSANWDAISLGGSITTGGGDVFFRAGDGFSTGTNGIGLSGNRSINSGTGDITLLADDVGNAVLTLDTTGHFTFAPNSTAWDSTAIGGQLDFTGSIGSDTLTGSGDVPWLTINNYSSLGGLTLGKVGNTSSIYVYNPINIAGPVNLTGADVTIAAGIDTSSSAGSEINLTASDSIVVAANQSLTTDGGDITFDGTVNSDGTARDLTISPGTANAIFNGDVGGSAALRALSVNGTSNVNADITTEGVQNWTDTITLGGSGARTLTAAALMTQEIVGGSSDINLVTDSLTLSGDIGSTGSLLIRPKTTGTSVGVGSGAGVLSVNAGELSLLQNGFSSITIGGTTAGDLSVGDLSLLRDDLTLQAGSTSDLFVTGDLSWNINETLTLAAGDDIQVLANIGDDGAAAGLNLYYGGTDGSSTPDAADNFYIVLADNRRIRFANTASTFNIGNEAYSLLDSVAGLQSMNASGNYALTGDLDLFGTTYTDAFYTTTFTGNLEGLGNVVDGLTIRDNDGGNLGLFARINGGSVRNLGGTMELTRSFSTANVSTQGSHTATGLGIGGLVGDISLKTNSSFSSTNAGTIAFDINNSYATGSIVQGTFDSYYGAGGLVGVTITSGNTINDSYSWGNVVGTGSFGGIVGYGWSLTANRVYTKQDSFGSLGGTSVYNNSYTSGTLDAATSMGAALPGTWDSNRWTVGEFPTLSALRTLQTALFVKILAGNTSAYGDAVAPTFQIVDSTGSTVVFGSGIYTDVGAPTGTGVYTIDSRANADTHDISYLRGLSLTGDEANLYALNPFSTAGSYVVTPRSISAVLSATGINKVYDGNTNAGSGYTPGWSFTNLLSGDSATLNTGSMFFNDADVLDTNLFTINGLSLAGITSGNGSLISDYVLASTSASVAANISAKPIVINGLFANDKIYDGTTAGTIDASGVTYSGLVSGDSVTLGGLGGTFADKNVGTNKTVSVTGSFTGTDVGNYSATLPSTLQADITAKAITLDGFVAANKVYDGAVAASISNAGSLAGVVAGDTVSVTNAGATFADENAATAKAVTLHGVAISGIDSANYTIASTATDSADITPKSIIVGGITADNRVYDGTTTATVDHSGTSFAGIVTGDNLSASGTTGAFGNKNVGTSKTVSLSGTTYGGTDVGNYSFTDKNAASNKTVNLSSTYIGVTVHQNQSGPTG